MQSKVNVYDHHSNLCDYYDSRAQSNEQQQKYHWTMGTTCKLHTRLMKPTVDTPHDQDDCLISLSIHSSCKLIISQVQFIWVIKLVQRRLITISSFLLFCTSILIGLYSDADKENVLLDRLLYYSVTIRSVLDCVWPCKSRDLRCPDRD